MDHKKRRKKNGAISLISLYLPAKSTMLIRDFFSISLPAAFLDFWVNLAGGKDLRMQKGKTTETRKRTPRPDPCICFVWKMQKTKLRESVPKHPFICLIYIRCKKTKRRMNPTSRQQLCEPLMRWHSCWYLPPSGSPAKQTFCYFCVCVYLICVGISYSFAFLCAIYLTNQISNILTEF